MGTAAQYEALARRVAKEKFGDSPLADVFYRMISQESGQFSPDVVEGRRKSSAGATGIAQLMPIHFKAVNPLDPEAALRYGADYLLQNLNYFKGDVAKAVAGYNAGPGGVDKAVQRGGANWITALPQETQLYLNITRPTEAKQSAAPAGAPAAEPRMPAQGPITSRFGTPFAMDSGATYQGRTYKAFNKGIDIGARGGSPVSSMAAGTVVLAGDDGSGWGPRVVVRDQDGFLHSYGHLGQLAVKQGDTVAAGQQIAVVGSGKVGTSTGEHLSYDVFEQDGRTPVDPSPWLGQDVVDPAIQHDPAQAKRPSYLGQSAASPAAPGGAGVTTPTAPTTTQWDEYAKLAKNRATLAQQAYDTALQRYNSLASKDYPDEKNPGNPNAMSEADVAWMVNANQTISILQRDAAQRADDALKAEQLRIEASQNGGAKPLTEAERLGYNRGVQQDARAAVKDYYDSVAAMAQNAFENDIASQRFVYDVLVRNFDQTLQQHNAQMEGRQMRLNEYNSVIAAESMQQQAESARFVQGLAAAKFINEANAQRAVMQLPAGQLHQSGWGPNDPMNQMLTSLGFNPVVIQAAQIPADWLDPAANMRQATAAQTEAGWGAPAFTTKPISDLAKEPMPAFTGQPLDAARFGITPDTTFKPPVAPDYGAIQAGYAQGAAGLPPSWLDLLPSALPEQQAQQPPLTVQLPPGQPGAPLAQQPGHAGSVAAFQDLENQAGPRVPYQRPDPRLTNPSGGYLTGEQRGGALAMGQSWFDRLPDVMAGFKGMKVDPETGDIIFASGQRFKARKAAPSTALPNVSPPYQPAPWSANRDDL